MDSIAQYYFNNFDRLIADGQLTANIENNINETKERLKNMLPEEDVDYTHYCLYLDKIFDEYIESKK